MEYVVNKIIKIGPNVNENWHFAVSDFEEEGVMLSYVEAGKSIQEVGIFCPDMARAIAKAIIEMADHSEADMKRIMGE